MDSGGTSPPAVVLIAAGAAIVVAALLFVGVAPVAQPAPSTLDTPAGPP